MDEGKKIRGITMDEGKKIRGIYNWGGENKCLRRG
jgi:hypothetical protein